MLLPHCTEPNHGCIRIISTVGENMRCLFSEDKFMASQLNSRKPVMAVTITVSWCNEHSCRGGNSAA